MLILLIDFVLLVYIVSALLFMLMYASHCPYIVGEMLLRGIKIIFCLHVSILFPYM